jgi:PiT family inorganic phosphate transporter
MVVAVLLLAMPGPGYQAAAQIVTLRAAYTGSGPAASGAASGPRSYAQSASGSGPISGADLRLSGPVIRLSAAYPLSVRSGLPAAAPAAMTASLLVTVRNEPDAARLISAAADSLGLPVPAAAPGVGRSRMESAGKTYGPSPELIRKLSLDPAAAENMRAAAAVLFDNQKAWASGPAAVAPDTIRRGALPIQASPLSRWTHQIRPRVNALYEKVMQEDEAPQPSRRVGALRTGLAGAMGLGLGIGALFSGAAAAAACWAPAGGAVFGLLGLSALGLGLRQRFGRPMAARRTSALAAGAAGLGVFLLGAAASPFLVGLIGLPVLHSASIGLIISIALGFEFLNGMNDAPNSVATVVATKTLSPRLAVAWAAFFNAAAYFVFGTGIAHTIGNGLINPAVMSNALLVAALLGGSAWNWLTIRLGIPVSSSHSLIGGLVGAAIVAGGLGAVVPAKLIATGAVMVVAPMAGLAVAFMLMAALIMILRGAWYARSDKAFGGGQLLSSALLSLGHGGNDSQKTIGIITALLFANGYLGHTFHVPWFVAAVCYLAMGLGTLAGGSKVMATLGEKVTKLDRPMGTAVNVGAGAAIMLSTWLGIPVSTTHVVTGSVAGVGAARNGTKSVQWKLLGNIAWAWVFTIPAAALVSGLIYFLFSLLVR